MQGSTRESESCITSCPAIALPAGAAHPGFFFQTNNNKKRCKAEWISWFCFMNHEILFPCTPLLQITTMFVNPLNGLQHPHVLGVSFFNIPGWVVTVIKEAVLLSGDHGLHFLWWLGSAHSIAGWAHSIIFASGGEMRLRVDPPSFFLIIL